MKLFAVIGFPIAHSLSSIIHKIFADQFGVKISYKIIEINHESKLSKIIEDFKVQSVLGINVTAPFKQKLFVYLVENLFETSIDANLVKAVNTITFLPNGNLYGDNTDGIGFIRDIIINHNISINNKKILILGAGGAARSILRALLTYNPKNVTIVNRNEQKALDIAKCFQQWRKIQTISYKDLVFNDFHIIINATSAGLYGEAPPLPKSFQTINCQCYDLNYGKAAKPFLNLTKELGASKVIDGLGMLIEQAAEAFYLWHAKRPNTSMVRSYLNHYVR